jgi:hypothetical protein
MASNIRVDVNHSAIRDLLRSREVERDEADSQIGTNRARASVRTVGPAAAMDEAIDHTLLRALDAGRG